MHSHPVEKKTSSVVIDVYPKLKKIFKDLLRNSLFVLHRSVTKPTLLFRPACLATAYLLRVN